MITNDNKPTNFLGDASEGAYMWPHVYADVTEDMECFHEEIFGPVVTVVKARDFDHALHLANASPYGLSSACYTNDRLEACLLYTSPSPRALSTSRMPSSA